MSTQGPSVHCQNHPERNAWAICVRCGVSICHECGTRDETGLVICVRCPSIDSQARAARPASAANEHGDGQLSDAAFIPWEQQATKNGISTFLTTVYFGFLNPIRYLNGINFSRRDLAAPFSFGLVAGCLGGVAALVPLLTQPEVFVQALSQMPNAPDVSPTQVFLNALLLIPVAITLALFVKTWLCHSMLRLLGGHDKSFSSTFRVFAYAEVAALLIWLPFVGPYAHKFFELFLLIYGLRSAHKLTYGSLMLALMPILLMPALISIPSGG